MTLFLAPAPVAHSFCPLITHWLPSRFALERMAPMSEPASGSDIEIENFTSPSSIFGIQWRFCSSVPLRRMLRPQNTGPP